MKGKVLVFGTVPERDVFAGRVHGMAESRMQGWDGRQNQETESLNNVVQMFVRLSLFC